MGNPDYVAETIGEYSTIGSAFRYMVMKGLHLKGYLLSQKSLFTSLIEWYDNLDAILNIGLGYEDIDGDEAIVVDKKESFYDSSDVSVEFFNVDKMIRRYDLEVIFNKVNAGYQTGKTNTIAANDDPFKATYGTKFSRSGKEVSIISNYIASPTLIEETRRQSVKKSSDWQLDDNTFIVAINPEPVDDDTFTPELTENFSGIANIQNADSKYNYRLWPVWSLIRWMNYFNGALQKYTTSVYRFTGGLGNYDAEAVMDPASEDLLTGTPTISQKGNIGVSEANSRGAHIHSDEIYECNVPMSWEQYKLIRASKKLAIGISQDETPTVPYFTKDLQWNMHNGSATLIVWPKDSRVSSVVPSAAALLLETGDYILQEDGSKILLE
jgi:hypothetical protein